MVTLGGRKYSPPQPPFLLKAPYHDLGGVVYGLDRKLGIIAITPRGVADRF